MFEDVYARCAFDYDGVSLEGGEVFVLRGCKNDQKLLEHRYALKTDGNQVIDCLCGKHFVGEDSYQKHLRGDKHPKELIVIKSEKIVAAHVDRPKKHKKKKASSK